MPWRPLPRDRAQEPPRPVSESLGRLAASLGAPPPDVLQAVFAHWEAIVGADIAAHARPIELRGGVLVVGVDQPAWATQLGFLRPELLRSVAAAAQADAVTDIRFRVDGAARSSRAPGRR